MRSLWLTRHQRGSVFLPTLVLVAVLTLLGAALFKLATIDAALSTQDTRWVQLLYCANAALGRTMADTAGRMVQISGLLNTANSVHTTLSPASETVTTSSVTCTTSVTFTTVGSLPALSGYLQATASTPDGGTTRSVRIQLVNLGYFQPPASPSDTWNDGSRQCYNYITLQSSCTAGLPYYSHCSFDQSGMSDTCPAGTYSYMNVGYYISNTGAYPARLSAYPINGTAGLPGPGTNLPYLANSDGTAISDFFLANQGGSKTVTFQWGNSTFVANSSLPAGEQYDAFGWFETNSTGTTLGALHPLFTANLSIHPGNTASFTPTAYYGFYVTNARGTFTTLRSLGTDSAPNGTGNTLTLGPPYCGTTSPPNGYPSNPTCSRPLQHLSVFQQGPTTLWLGAEDLYNLGPKPGQTGCTSSGPFPACFNRSNVDGDYQDVIFKIVLSAGDQVRKQVAGGGSPPADYFRTWKDWQECPPCS